MRQRHFIGGEAEERGDRAAGGRPWGVYIIDSADGCASAGTVEEKEMRIPEW